MSPQERQGGGSHPVHLSLQGGDDGSAQRGGRVAPDAQPGARPGGPRAAAVAAAGGPPPAAAAAVAGPVGGVLARARARPGPVGRGAGVGGRAGSGGPAADATDAGHDVSERPAPGPRPVSLYSCPRQAAPGFAVGESAHAHCRHVSSTMQRIAKAAVCAVTQPRRRLCQHNRRTDQNPIPSEWPPEGRRHLEGSAIVDARTVGDLGVAPAWGCAAAATARPLEPAGNETARSRGGPASLLRWPDDAPGGTTRMRSSWTEMLKFLTVAGHSGEESGTSGTAACERETKKGDRAQPMLTGPHTFLSTFSLCSKLAPS